MAVKVVYAPRYPRSRETAIAMDAHCTRYSMNDILQLINSIILMVGDNPNYLLPQKFFLLFKKVANAII